MQYRTEIEVADDRYVCLQLPDFIPPGRATVTVAVIAATIPAAPADDEDRSPGAIHPDAGDDIEWWEEFDGDDRAR